MSIIFVLLPVSVFLGLVALIAYLWAVKQGQFDDLDTPAIRMIFDDPETKEKISATKQGADSKPEAKEN